MGAEDEGTNYFHVWDAILMILPVPRYDARKTRLNLTSPRPWERLPKYEGEFEQGDIIYLGFTSSIYTRKNPDFLGMDITSMSIKWAALVSRGGQEAFNAVFQPVTEPEKEKTPA